MANQILIKRSTTTSIPASLANGELAYTANGDTLYIGSNGQIVAIGGIRNPGVLTSNQALIANSTSGIDKVITANLVPTAIYANGSFGSAGQVLTTNTTAVYWSTPSAGGGGTPAGTDTQIQYNSSSSFGASAGLTFNYSSNTLNVSNTISTANLSITNQLTGNNATFTGNLVVSGTLVTLNVQNIVVNDPLIKLGANNTSTDMLDLGFYSSYYTGSTTGYSGFFRDATSKTYKLFDGLTQEPTTTILGGGGAGYSQATIQAYINAGALVSNSSVTNITANSTISSTIAANTLTLSTALSGTNGGTGLTSYTSQDILVANSTNGFSKLALGTSGYILQSNGTALVYAALDGGTF